MSQDKVTSISRGSRSILGDDGFKTEGTQLPDK